MWTRVRNEETIEREGRRICERIMGRWCGEGTRRGVGGENGGRVTLVRAWCIGLTVAQGGRGVEERRRIEQLS